jgi:hypothetical protein
MSSLEQLASYIKSYASSAACYKNISHSFSTRFFLVAFYIKLYSTNSLLSSEEKEKLMNI